MIRLIQPEVLLAVVWSLVCFVAGVAYAAYRALSWVDRMRTWAYTTTTEGIDS